MEVLQSTRNTGQNVNKEKKDQNQLQEQLIYQGSGFIELHSLSTSIQEIPQCCHVSGFDRLEANHIMTYHPEREAQHRHQC